MATAPKVQTLAQAMTDLDPAYAAGRNIVAKRQSALPAKYDAQRAGITAERGRGFATINNQATARGGSFSGIPLDEQATYLSTKYLPGMMQADYQQNEEDMALQGELAAMSKEQRLSAQGRVDKQVSDLNSWNQMIQQQEFQRQEAERQRRFQAEESARDRAAQAARDAASRAAQAPQGPSNSEIISNLNTWASKRWGGDKKLSPSDFKAGYQQAAQYGMSVDDYVAVMQRYVNNSHAKDYRF